MLDKINWCENVILVDADYIDKVAFDLIVNFERMLERRIPQADLAQWLVCVALDGGLRPKEDGSQHEVQVVFLHKRAQLTNFNPSTYTDIDGKAFKDSLGEFSMSAYYIEDIVSAEDYFTQVLDVMKEEKNIKRLMVIPDAEQYLDKIKHSLADVEDKKTTVFTMQPIAGGNFNQEILGYSIMSALGISSSEFSCKS